MVSRKAARRYIYFFIKNRLFYLFFISIGIASILFFMITIEVEVKKTYNGEIRYTKNKYIIIPDEPVKVDNLDHIFIYKDKNDYIYKVSDFSLNNKSILFGSEHNKDIHEKFMIKDNNPVDIKIEISTSKISLIKKVFINGGKS